MFESSFRTAIYVNGSKLYKNPAAVTVFSNLYLSSYSAVDFHINETDLSEDDHIQLALISPEGIEYNIAAGTVQRALPLTRSLVRYFISFDLSAELSIGLTEETAENIFKEIFSNIGLNDYELSIPALTLPHFKGVGQASDLIDSVVSTIKKAEDKTYFSFFDEESIFRIVPCDEPYKSASIGIESDFNTIHISDRSALLFAAPFRAGQQVSVDGDSHLITSSQLTINGTAARTRISWEDF